MNWLRRFTKPGMGCVAALLLAGCASGEYWRGEERPSTQPAASQSPDGESATSRAASSDGGSLPPRDAPTPPRASLLELVDGGLLIADDGEYLGCVCNRYTNDSIANEYGEYGSPYAEHSMFNEYGDYGSPYGTYSPFNEFASTPPVVYVGGEAIAYVTVNRALSPRIHPLVLKDLASRSTTSR